MKKNLLLILFAVLGLSAYAQDTPSITLTAKVEDKPLTLTFTAAEAGHKYSVDWGDGILVETEVIATENDFPNTTSITGTPANNGEIKVYGEKITAFDCSYSAAQGTKLTALDVTKAADLQDLTCNTHEIATLDVTQNPNLEALICYANPIQTLNLENNTMLTKLDAKDMKLESIDISNNTKITSLTLNNNIIGSINLEKCTELKSLYLINCGLSEIDLSKNKNLLTINLNNNLLKTLDVTACEALATGRNGGLYCSGNQITELKTGEISSTARVTISSNNLTLSNLPAIVCKAYNYAPQNAMQIAETIMTGEKLDLSAQNNITGLADGPQATSYIWMTENGTELVKGQDYNEENGVFTFLKKQDEKIFCQMTTDAFPKFTGNNVFKTTPIQVNFNSSVMSVNGKQVVVSATKGMICIQNLPAHANVKVYGLGGQTLVEQQATDSRLSFSMQPGFYIVSVNGTTHKVNIR